MKKYLFFIISTLFWIPSTAQDVNLLVQKVKLKLDQVNDYEASARMKTNIAFLKVPESDVKIYYKKPDKLRIKNDKGISFVPKGAVNINMNNILSGSDYTIIDAGISKLGAKNVRVVKLLPADDNSNIVLSTLYIDEVNHVIRKVKTTTRDHGSFELDMDYGKYISYGLPDKLIFSFNTKDYKMPKGVTFDFDDGENEKAAEKMKNRKGKVEINYRSYIINKGVSDEVFK